MILTVLFLTLVSSCLAQPADNNEQLRSSRAPQGQIQYSRPDGLKVDWKQYLPSVLPISSRSGRQDTNNNPDNFVKNQQPVKQSPTLYQPEYKPYSAVPSHIKQLIVQAYSPQGPYVDPGAFFYKATSNQHAASSLDSQDNYNNQRASTFSPDSKMYFNSAVSFGSAGFDEQPNNQRELGTFPKKQLIGGIKYKNEDRVFQRSAEIPYGSVLPTAKTQTKQQQQQYQPYKQIQNSQLKQYNDMQTTSQNQRYNDKTQPYFHYQQQQQQDDSRYKQQSMIEKFGTHTNYNNNNNNNNMPNAIETLLSYQSQLPYNVIANNILYRPKHIFIPKPLPESAKIDRAYPSKIYFVQNNGEFYDNTDNSNDNDKQEKKY